MIEVSTQRADVAPAPGVTLLSGDSAPGGAASSTVAVTVRYFAAARAASQVDEETLAVRSPASVESVLAAAVESHGDALRRVLERCSYLLNSVAVHGLSTPLGDGDALDVLPPFAGG